MYEISGYAGVVKVEADGFELLSTNYLIFSIGEEMVAIFAPGSWNVVLKVKAE